MSESIKVTDDMNLWVADGTITLFAGDGNDAIRIELDDIYDLNRALARAHIIATEQQASNPCPYTNAHTRQWCGYPQCRKS